MSNVKFGLSMAVKEHLMSGQPITRLEALVLYGMSNLTMFISQMRTEGWVIEKRRVPFAVAVKRINEYAVLSPPKNLPVREIVLTEYWINK